ncbi:amino acid adenylation domain-containing protein [Paenibacillus mucilaginosus]|uniref:amino acid adenylation domain-containing protein n=1 Tax=Paenibacillus mucilaginosus TaxID=61624 RepID=UPI003D1AB392
MIEILPEVNSLVELLRCRAERQSDATAFSFLTEDGKENVLTYGDLDRRARTLAVWLARRDAGGKRALLLYPPGLDYIAAFFGCLYAGTAAVPAYPPRLNANLRRMQSIVSDCRADFALTDAPTLAQLQLKFPDSPLLTELQWGVTDSWSEEDPGSWSAPAVGAQGTRLAFLQYTSGSTSAPKGVMLTHDNLLHNLGLIQRSFCLTPESRSVIWLPPYHDMGLIGGILQPLYTGFPVTLMSPAHFVQSPLKWLETISRTGASVSGGPNFAYELCVRKIAREELQALDLSRWTCAFTGSEPIQAETLKRFAEVFEPCGFRYESFYPCYGLAESTLFVTGAQRGTGPVVRSFEGKMLEENRVVTADSDSADGRSLVSSGCTLESDPQVVIVDPLTGERCGEDRVGEVWITGRSVAQGYWNREEQTAETFGGQLYGGGGGPFLRTGDLGFLSSGELFVTGRWKDLIIIRGRNYYPQDIEFCVSESHPAVRSGNGAAFSVTLDGEERLVIVHELERAFRKSDPLPVFESIVGAVAERCGLQVHAIALIRPASIHKTSSGKIQRSACRQAYLEGTLEILAKYREDGEYAGAEAPGEKDEADGSRKERPGLPDRAELLKLPDEERRRELVHYLCAETAHMVKGPSRCGPESTLQTLGFDSLMIVEWKARIEEVLEVDIPFDTLLDGPSLSDIAAVIDRLLLASEYQGEKKRLQAEPASQAEFPLSAGQRALWFLQKLNPAGRAYIISRTLHIRSGLRPELFVRAIDALHQRHPLLRSRVVERDGEPVLIPDKAVRDCITYTDTAGWPEVQVLERIREASELPVDLEQGPLFRVHLYGCGEGEAYLLFTLHHIIGDFWSFAVLAKEFGEVYSALTEDRNWTLPAEPGSYRTYVERQREALAGEAESGLTFWQSRLQGAEPVQLQHALPAPAPEEPRGRKVGFSLSSALSRRLAALARESGCSLYSTLLSAFTCLLHRYTGQSDLTVGTPTSGRLNRHDAGTFGYFVNPVVIRTASVPRETVREMIGRVHQGVTEALKHQTYPFPLLVERLQPHRGGRQPLFNVMFSMHVPVLEQDDGLVAAALGLPGAAVSLGPLTAELSEPAVQEAQFDLTLTMGRVGEVLHGSLEYDPARFTEEGMRRLAAHLTVLLEGMAQNPDERAARLPLLTREEEAWQAREWNSTNTPYPGPALQERFESWAEQAPERTAVVYQGRTVSYGELNRTANRLAHRLQSLGVGPDTLVGVCLDRSPELAAGLLAVLKSGGAYVPLDPSLPAQRLAYMTERAGLKALVTKRAWAEGFTERAGLTVICMDEEKPVTGLYPETNPQNDAGAEHLMYVIYTSGSTGTPKGASVYRRGFANLMQWYTGEFGMSEEDRILLISSPSFDLTQKNIFAPLVTGGQLVLLPSGPYDAREVSGLISRHGITLLNGTPSAFYPLLQETEAQGYAGLSTLRHVFLGGEAIAADKLAAWTQSPSCRAQVVNTYGPTECTDVTVFSRLTDMKSLAGKPVPIGRPVPNTRLYILNSELGMVPAGAPGELCIAGVQVGGGYLGDPGLTAEQFTANPYGDEAAPVLYRTGDLARYLPDGTVEYLGRMDHQVKIRGYRIEPGEIEAALRECGGVSDAFVMAREDRPGEHQLAAYIVGGGVPGKGQNAADFVQQWRMDLRRKLPDYMVPSAFVLLDRLPLSPNGKVDRKALPVPEGGGIREQPYTPPRTRTESALAVVWAEVLGLEKVGIHDNFFELGGHSLLATQVISRIRTSLQADLPVHRLFDTPTIAELAAALEEESTPKPSKPRMTRLSRSEHRVQ